MKRNPALVVLDLINELVHPDGKYAEVCLAQIIERRVLERTATAIDRAREAGIPVVYVVVGFAADYSDWPESSPLFQEAPGGHRLVLGTWATEVHDTLKPAADEPVVAKNRVNPFYETELETILREHGVDTLLLAGATTDLVVLSAAREGHDRDYRVEVLEDATATSDPELHRTALTLISRTATITTVDAALPQRR
jgi:nicotinamidase-related amidase